MDFYRGPYLDRTGCTGWVQEKLYEDLFWIMHKVIANQPLPSTCQFVSTTACRTVPSNTLRSLAQGKLGMLNIKSVYNRFQASFTWNSFCLSGVSWKGITSGHNRDILPNLSNMKSGQTMKRGFHNVNHHQTMRTVTALASWKTLQIRDMIFLIATF